MAHPINKTFICEECVFVFTVHSKQKTKPYCPNCADNISIKKFVKPIVHKKEFWTDEELKLVDRVISGEVLIYQAAVKLGRTRKSIARRVERRIEELQN